MPRGGARPGAGRKKKNRDGQELFESAEDYLQAVVKGKTPPDAVRVQAARTLIQYERAKSRAPVKSPSPKKLQEQSQKDLEKSNLENFEVKAAKIREKYQRG